jgi:hypothetical protein
LDDDWRASHAKWVHTLGNLTLTGYNLQLSNSSFVKKKELFAESHLSLNKYFVNLPQWDAQAIKDRGLILAQIVAERYPRPRGGPPYVPLGPSLADGVGEAGEEPEPAGGGAAPVRGRLKITIRWELLGVEGREQTICERQSAHSIVVFLAELIRVFGEPVKQQLTELPVIRFPLSRNRDDFMNNRIRRRFGSSPVPGTDPVLYFCPQSGNAEKVTRLRTLVSRLRLPGDRRCPDGSVQVSITDEPPFEYLIA